MNPYERQILNDAEEQVFQTQQEFNEASEASGIRPPPDIEETESILEPQLFGMWFGAQPESDAFGAAPSSTRGPEILYIQLRCISHEYCGFGIFPMFNIGVNDPGRAGNIKVLRYDLNHPASSGWLFRSEATGGGLTDAGVGSAPVETWFVIDLKIDFSVSPITVTPRINGTALSSFSAGAYSIHKFHIGAADNTSNEVNDRQFDYLTLGTTTWGSYDIFSADFASSITPPFDSVTGVGVNLDSGTLHVKNGLVCDGVAPCGTCSDPHFVNCCNPAPPCDPGGSWLLCSPPVVCADPWPCTPATFSCGPSPRQTQICAGTQGYASKALIFP